MESESEGNSESRQESSGQIGGRLLPGETGLEAGRNVNPGCGFSLNLWLLPLSFLSQSIHLLEEDSSVYCISAWNDQVG